MLDPLRVVQYKAGLPVPGLYCAYDFPSGASLPCVEKGVKKVLLYHFDWLNNMIDTCCQRLPLTSLRNVSAIVFSSVGYADNCLVDVLNHNSVLEPWTTQILITIDRTSTTKISSSSIIDGNQRLEQ